MPTLPSFSRRRLLPRAAALLAVAAFPVARLAGAQARTLEPTPPDAEGPFYPTSIPADADADLTRVAGRSERAKGTPLALAGRVLLTDGQPLAKAKVELWQCDVNGRYHHVGGSGDGIDPNFQGYGVVETDAQGRFAFRTIRPVPYGGRPPHLHVKLAHPGARPLTTQIYPKGESAERFSGFGLSSRDARSRLEFVLAGGREANSLESTYDFVLRAA
jgi:protocatechuate 3,4-dioxygenase beta subunit